MRKKWLMGLYKVLEDIKISALFWKIFSLNLFFSFLLSTSISAQSINYSFERITVKDGLSQSTGTYIIQDKNGFMWFATFNGINKYNGYTITTYIHDKNDTTSLSHNGIVYLFEDNDGFIWAANNGMAGLDKYNPKTDNFTRYKYNPKDSTSISSNDIYHVMQDKLGNIWICTSNALNLVVQNKDKNHTTTSFKRYYYPENAWEFSMAYEDKNDHLLLFSNSLFYFDRESHLFINTNIDIGKSEKTSLAEDKSGNIFIGTLDAGIIKLAYNSKSLDYTRVPTEATKFTQNKRSFVLVDDQEQLWIGTLAKGLYKYDETKNQVLNFITDKLDAKSISDNTIQSLYIDRYGILWIGTFSQGICKYDMYSKEFSHLKSVPGKPNTLSGNIISSIHGIHPEELWIGIQQDGGVNRIIFRENDEPKIIYYKHNPDDENTIDSDNTLCLIQRKNGNVWVGSVGGYISKIIPEDPETGNRAIVHRYPIQGWTFTLFEDSEGILWGGTWDRGLWKFDDTSNKFTYYLHDEDNPSSLCDNVVWAMGEDRYHNIWIGGNSKGLSILTAKEKGKTNPEFINFEFKKGISGSLSSNTINAFYEDKKGSMWIATNGGLNKVLDSENTLGNGMGNIKLKFLLYHMTDGLPSEGIIGLVEDEKGNIWMSTSNGISKFDFSDSTFYNYFESDGLQGDEFWHNAFYKNSEGRIFFGGANGITAFYPDKIKANPFIPEIVITDLKIFNKSIKIGEKINNNIILTKPLGETSEISLSYKNNVFTIEFAALHFAQPNENQYAYYLEGFEENWNYVKNQRSATYTNLNPGKYTFRVKGSNNNGIWNETGTYLTILVKPPWWKTWWFRIAGLILCIMILLLIYSIKVSQIKKKNIYLENKVKDRTKEIDNKNKLLYRRTLELKETNIVLEERQQQVEEQAEELIVANEQLTDSNSKLSEMNSMKDKIFSIIGHDLKNPINVIMGFSEILQMKMDKLAKEKRHIYIRNIFESSKKTYQLLESLLSWARSQNEQLKFEPKEIEIKQLILESILMLKEQASKKNITIIFDHDNDEGIAFCDHRMVETVLRNLISNAIKYSRSEGDITVSCSMKQNPGFNTIHVVDTGLGISAEQIQKLFHIEKSFSTVGTNGETGTGLGLILCKEFIEKNKGKIWVESKIGIGTTFSFTLPIDSV